jgi:hypothetical protein
MCERLVQLLDVVYQKRDTDISRLMGYANTSTLYRIRRGTAFPDVERLERLVGHSPKRGVVVNLNWIIAGRGKPLLRVTDKTIRGEMTLGEFIDDAL